MSWAAAGRPLLRLAAVTPPRALPGLPVCRTLSVDQLPDVTVTRACAARILELKKNAAAPDDVRLRLSVEGGGCSGFQYAFDLDSHTIGPGDYVFERDGAEVVVDDASLEFVRGATVDFVSEMIRSSFAVVNNPNSESACGCGSSFALKNFADNPALD